MAIKLRGKSEARLTWTGQEALAKKLDALGKKAARKALRPAMEAGAEVIRKEARLNAARVTNAEAAAQIVLDVSSVGQFKAVARVGVPGGRHPGYILKFVEFGTGGHRSPRRGTVTASRPSKSGAKAIATPFGPRASVTVGGVRARPWLRPAFDTKSEAARDKIGEVLWEKIQEVSRGTA